MTRVVLLALAGLMVAVGVLWTLQGLGYVSDSPMTGVRFWALVGPVLAGFGVALAIVAVRRGDRR